jgi:hypothetical protein
MFQRGEATACPVCGVELTSFEKLAPSVEAEPDDNAPKAPEYEYLPAAYLGRNKGILAVLGLVGVVFFLLPWIHVTMPHDQMLTGFDMAKRLGWTWGAGVAWLVLIPTVLSRRSIVQMRGARVATAFLSLVPAATVGILMARTVHGTHGVPLKYGFVWPAYAMLALSAVTFVFALGLGGRVDDARVVGVSRGTSRGKTLH